jgi:ATP-binding cassette, subfamily B, bacterial
MATQRTAPAADAAPHRPQASTVWRALGYLKEQLLAIAALLAVILLDSLLVLAPPLLFQRIIDDGIAAGDLGTVAWLAAAAFVAVLLYAATRTLVQWLSARLGEQLVYQLRNDLFAHTQQLALGFYITQRSGALASRLSNDTSSVQAVISNVLPQLVSSLVRLVVIIAAIAYLSWPVLLLMLVMPLLLVLPAYWVGRLLRDTAHGWMRSQADLMAFITERFNVAGAMLSQLYGARTRDHRDFVRVSARNRDIGVKMTMIAAVFSIVLSSVSSISIVAIYLLGGYLVIINSMTLGTLVALTVLAPQLLGPVRSLSQMQADFMKMLASFERVFDLLDHPPTILERSGACPLPPGPKTLEFRDVHFSYVPQRGVDNEATALAETESVPVLHGVSLRLEPGQRVGLVGPSGAGKSTVAALAARLYDVDAGQVQIGGLDVRDAKLASLRSIIGILTQEAHFFHDTIRANLHYAAANADETAMVDACKAASIWSKVARLPDGLDTVIGDRGHRLSGGEKQRLALARLLLRDPEIVILDEATAHLDRRSEQAVQEALERCLSERAVLIIAHRLSTIENTDEILLLEGGQIVERGKHKDLMHLGGKYAALYRNQQGVAAGHTPVPS